MFFNIFNRKKNEDVERSLVIGSDRKLMPRMLLTTGAFLRDETNFFAYDNTPENMIPYIVYNKRGVAHYRGQCCLLYEVSAQPWLWNDQKWSDHVTNERALLADGRMEAVGNISKSQEDDEKWARFMPVLYGSLIILGLIALIACLQAGIFSKIGDIF